VDGAKWKALTEKQASTVELDPKMTTIDESVADLKFPGYFNVLLDGRKRMRLFNANDHTVRQAWASAISMALNDAMKAKRPRTMRLVGGALETTCYPTVVMDSFLLAPVDAVEEAICQSPSVLAAVSVKSGYKDVQTSPWQGSTRMISYTDDSRGGKVMETWVRARTEPGRGFVVDRRVEAPNAQFGQDFAIKCRFVLIAAEMMGEKACRVLVSLDVEFIQQNMMVGFITSGARTWLTSSLREVWLPAVVAYLQSQGFLPTQPRVADSNIHWGPSAVGSSKSKQFAQQRSGPIEVGQI